MSFDEFDSMWMLENMRKRRKMESFELQSLRNVVREGGVEMKEYRKMTGKITWLANTMRPDLSFIALKMSKNSKEATISDLRDVNQILAKEREHKSKVKYEHVGEKEDLVVVKLDMLHSSLGIKQKVELCCS